MKTKAYYINIRKLLIMTVLAVLASAAYMLVDVNFSNSKLFAYALQIRTPKLIVMVITAFAIGGASLIFQSVINNTIVTPCLLGMNSADLYNATDYDGEYITYCRTKTKDRRNDQAKMVVRVHPFIKPLVEKYRGKERVFNFSERFSSMGDLNRSINIGLKEIGKELGIENLQFYAARHSFASISANEVKIDGKDYVLIKETDILGILE